MDKLIKLPKQKIDKFIFLSFYFVFVIVYFIFLWSAQSLSWFLLFYLDSLIVVLYLFLRPVNIFHPNTMMFIFSFFYVVLPTVLQFLFMDFGVNSGLLPDQLWINFNPLVCQDILLSYLILYLSFYVFSLSVKYICIPRLSLNKTTLLPYTLFVLLALSVFLVKSGGIMAWFINYKIHYLVDRLGLGAYNYIWLYNSYIVIFLSGLFYFNRKRKHTNLVFLLLLIVVFSWFSGLKSQLPIYLILFFYCRLNPLLLSYRRIILYGTIFMVFLFGANYIRSDGYYDSIFKNVAYLPHYFNAYYLYNLILNSSHPDLFKYIALPFNKYLAYLNSSYATKPFDLSALLSAKYFSQDWYVFHATQQWPLITDLRFNWYGMRFGWLPLIIYAFIISSLYKEFSKGNKNVLFIYLFEWARIFTVQRDMLIPSQILMLLIMYFIYYCYAKLFVKYSVYMKQIQ